jgi:hypothetical protein
VRPRKAGKKFVSLRSKLPRLSKSACRARLGEGDELAKRLSPITSRTTKVSAAAKQKH